MLAIFRIQWVRSDLEPMDFGDEYGRWLPPGAQITMKVLPSCEQTSVMGMYGGWMSLHLLSMSLSHGSTLSEETPTGSRLPPASLTPKTR